MYCMYLSATNGRCEIKCISSGFFFIFFSSSRGVFECIAQFKLSQLKWEKGNFIRTHSSKIKTNCMDFEFTRKKRERVFE